MAESEEVRELMARLMAAVEASLSGSTEVREALAELARNGYEPRLYFVANAETADEESGEGGEADGDADEPEGVVLRELAGFGDDDLSADLTKLDRDFLRSLQIRPEPG